MTGAARTRAAADERDRERTGSQASPERNGGLAALNALAGNRAATAAVRGTAPDLERRLGPGRGLRAGERSWLEAAAGPLPDVTIDDGGHGQLFASMAGAQAAARDSTIAAGPNALDGPSGRLLLAHEMAHVLQQRATGLPRAGEAAAEADADRFAHAAVSGERAAVSVSADAGWAYQAKTGTALRVTGVTVVLLTGEVTVSTTTGDQPATLIATNLPLGRSTGFGRGNNFTLSPGVGLQFALPLDVELEFPKQFPIAVVATAEDLTRGEGGGGGAQAVKEPKKKGKGTKTQTPPKSEEPDWRWYTGGAGEEAGAPRITVADRKQLTELIKRGLLPADVGQSMLDKQQRGETLSYEDALALLDALNKIAERGKRRKPQTGEKLDEWVRVARFIRENKEKFSGRTASGQRGLSAEELRELLATYREFVGVTQPGAATGEKKEEDPEKRKGWNELEDWERQLWRDYWAWHKKTDKGRVDKERDNLHLTDDDRLSIALQLSTQYLEAGFREAAEEMFNDPMFIGGIAVGIAAYIALWLFPNPIFIGLAMAISLLLLAVFTVSEIMNLVRAWTGVSFESKVARSFEDLRAAGERFGKATGGTTFRVLVMIFMYLAGKALPKAGTAPKMGGGGGAGTAGAESASALERLMIGGPGGGAGGGAGAAVMGRPAVGQAAVEAIQVLADGTVVIVKVASAGAVAGGPLGPTMMAMQGPTGGGGGGGKESTGKGSGQGKKEPAKAQDKEPKPKKEKPKKEPKPKKSKDKPLKKPRDYFEEEPRTRDPKAKEVTRDPTTEEIIEGAEGKRGTFQEGEATVIGSADEVAEAIQWTPKLQAEGYTEVYRRGGGWKGLEWIKQIFTGNRAPDLLGIDRTNHRLLVGDVTSRPGTTVPNEFGPGDRSHLDKTLEYARLLLSEIRNNPKYAEFKEFTVWVKERYWATGEITKPIPVKSP
jgi:Domain of unknown function (DUF4157)